MFNVMLRRSVYLFAPLALAIGWLHGAGLIANAKPAPVVPAAAQAKCGALKTQCNETSRCCDGLVCNASLAHTGPATCVAKLEMGAGCTADLQCESENCSNGKCSASDCEKKGTRCIMGGRCCRGLICTAPPHSYAPGVCSEPLAKGTYCLSPEHCASKKCTNNKCE